jgi:hypothetical protein
MAGMLALAALHACQAQQALFETAIRFDAQQASAGYYPASLSEEWLMAWVLPWCREQPVQLHSSGP